jgi:colanic acid/amylovoran biosynthesis glycosyltransferase
LKIGIIVEKFPSISETFILNKVEGLCGRGHEVVVFRNQRFNDSELEELTYIKDIPNLTLVNISIPNKRLELAGRLIRRPAFAMGMLRTSSMKKNMLAEIRNDYFKSHRCDIYHFEFSALALHYEPSFKNIPGKIVCSCRGTAEKVKPVTTPGRKEQLVQLFNVVDKIHCVSDDMANTIKKYGAPQDKIFVNRPAIQTKYFAPLKSSKNNDKIQIVSVGRLSFQKGFLIGLLAIRDVVTKFPGIEWKIIGDGPLKEELQFYINDLGLTESVTLVGAVSKKEVIKHLQQADIFFLPSIYEGIANVVLEAMAMELPVVSSDCSGMKEVITHNVDGLLAANYNAPEMANSLIELIQSADKRMSMGKAARKTVQARFDIERQLDVFEEQYQQLLKRS